MSKTLICFRDNIISFIDELIEQFPQEADFVILRIFFKDKISMDDVLKYCIKTILPLEDYIKNRDEKFFLDNNILFSAVDNNKVNHFKNLWLSKDLDQADRKIIWDWFDLFVSLMKKYNRETSKN